MTVSRSQTQTNYDRLSRWYDLLAGPSERACREQGLRELGLRTGEQVLEIGSATAQALPALSQAVGAGGLVCGLDLAPAMCRIAARRIRGLPASAAEVSIVCADAVHLPFRSGSFDALFMSFTLELFAPADLIAVLAECARVLKPAGRLGVVALANRGRAGRMQRAYEWAHERFPAWVDCRPIQVEGLLAGNGFEVCDVTHMGMWGLPVDIVVAVNTAAAE